MNFIATIQEQFKKLSKPSTVTKIWEEIRCGKKNLISSEELFEYSVHYPVDTELYLAELLMKFNDSQNEEFETIDKNLKAYLQTFLYYFMGATDKISTKSSLLAVQLYFKLILLPSNIGNLYFERNICTVALVLVNKSIRKETDVDQIKTIFELNFNLVAREEVPFSIFQATVNLYSNTVTFRAPQGKLRECDDILVSFCLNCFKELIKIKEQPNELKHIMESMLRSLRKEASVSSLSGQRKNATNMFKDFIKNVLLVEIEEQWKLQYLVDGLFSTITCVDFEGFEDATEIANMLKEECYKEILTRIPNYLESKNHESSYANIMQMVYFMLKNPHPDQFNKLDVLFSVCLKNIVMHLLSKKKQIQSKTVEILGNICCMENNLILDKIFELINTTSKLADLDFRTILNAIIKLLNEQHARDSKSCKNILHILTKVFTSLNQADESLFSKALNLICKDGTPFSVKPILTNLHSLYLKLTGRTASQVAIMKIFFKMAMHPDQSASVFVEHLYHSVLYSTELDGKTYGSEKYSNVLFTDEFDYDLLVLKWKKLIKYQHVSHVINNYQHREPGHSILLNSLLNYVQYKEYEALTSYITANIAHICMCDFSYHILDSYKRILQNRTDFPQADLRKFRIIHTNLWNMLIKQLCPVSCVKSFLELVRILRNILGLPNDDAHKENLLTYVSECAYRSLRQNHISVGSIMHLTELCVTFKKLPPNQIILYFEQILEQPENITLLQAQYQETLIQLISFFGTIAMLDRQKIPVAIKLFDKALTASDVTVQITTIKIYYSFCTEIIQEFDEIIKFCFRHITGDHLVLTRVCLTILEELIHNNYVLLNAEDFIRFIRHLASSSLHIFMRHLLNERFLISNKHDVGRFYVTTLVYMSGYQKLDNYPITGEFFKNINDHPNELMNLLFNAVQVKTKFNILKEICLILDLFVQGKCTLDDDFFVLFHYFLYTFKVMSEKMAFTYKESFYNQVIRSIDKQIFSKDPKYKGLSIYGDYDSDVKQCTMSLLTLVSFIQEQEEGHLIAVLDTVICWIDHIKPELIHYIQYENCKDFQLPLKKLNQIYQTNKQQLEEFLNNCKRTTI